MKINELSAEINVGKGVFYNPKMHSLRSISTAFLKANAPKGSRLLDATSATGIRGIRYAIEAGIKNPVLIDMNKEAYESTLSNADANGIKADVRNVSFQEFANTSGERFDVIDIDPFGTPAPLIYDAFKISKDGTLLMITATDTAVLHGAHANACMKIYGAVPMHTELCKEAGARILLGFVARNASQFNYGIEPLLTISDMHYLRLFIKVNHGAAKALASVKSLGILRQCLSCRYFDYKYGISCIGSDCPSCGSKMSVAGQLWLNRMHDKGRIGDASKALAQIGDDEAAKQMQAIEKELDIPFLYSIPKLTRSIKSGSVSHKRVMGFLLKSGYSASETQFWKDSIKTDAPHSEVLSAVKQSRE